MDKANRRPRRRRALVALSATLGLMPLPAVVGGVAWAGGGAPTVTPLESAAYTGAVTQGAWSLPTYSAGNAACLTSVGIAAGSVPPGCAGASDASGSGVLQLTRGVQNQVGAVFDTTSFPTSKGFDASFTSYQYGTTTGTGADGLSFSIAATNPADPAPPTSSGPLGGSLGYTPSSLSGAPGLPYGYLGFGFDVYGNYLNPQYQGSGCAASGYTAGHLYPEAVTVRGPGNGTVGYCLSSTTGPLTNAYLDDPAATGHTHPVHIEIALNPTSTASTTASGLSVPAGGYVVAFTPLTSTGAAGTTQTLTGTLPNLSSSPVSYPAGWIDSATGMPYQLAFGWTAATGTSDETHAVSGTQITTLTGQLPVLSLAADPTTGQVTAGTTGALTFTPTLSASQGSETEPVTFTATLPAALTPNLGSVTTTGWNCSASSGSTLSCTYTPTGSGLAAGASLPAITVPVTAAGTETTAAVTETVSSDDADPATLTDQVVVGHVPGSVTNAGITVADTTATVTWTDPADTGGAPDSYIVTPYIGGVAQTPTTYPPGTTSATETGLQVGSSVHFTVQATNSFGSATTVTTGTDQVTTAGPTIPTPALPEATPGTAYSATLGATGGTGPDTWTLTSGSLPAGLTLSSSGVISGTPSTTGASTFTVTVTDHAGQAAHATVTLDVAPPLSVATTGTLPEVQAGVAYTDTLSAAGGTVPDSWTVVSGTLPPGLTLSPSGVLSGTTTDLGSRTVTVGVTDAGGEEAQRSVTVSVVPPLVVTTPAPALAGLGDAPVGTPVDVDLATSGGSGATTWSVGPGGLPPGLSLAPDGALTGTVEAGGTFLVTLIGTDPGGGTTTVSVHFDVPIVGANSRMLAATLSTRGYWVVTRSGRVTAYGNAARYRARRVRDASPVVGIYGDPLAAGYWIVRADGRVTPYGAARTHKAHGRLPRHARVVGLVATFDAGGYWLVTSTGRVVAYGDATGHGSARRATGVVGMAETPTGHGYWLVSSTGRVWAFGDAARLRALRGRHHGIVGIVATPDGRGYYLVSATGRVWTVGDARFAGRGTRRHPRGGVVSVAITTDGRGWSFVGPTGRVTADGDARTYRPAGRPSRRR